jgi:hypothetical protein
MWPSHCPDHYCLVLSTYKRSCWTEIRRGAYYRPGPSTEALVVPISIGAW